MDNLKFKNFEITEHKSDDSGQLIISGYGAVFGNIDSYNEVIERGAFTKTLIDRKERVAFCYQHDIWNPIGKIIELREDEKGLFVKAVMSAAEEDIQTKIKEEILKEMSIGYRPINTKSEMRNGIQVDVLTEIKLIEISLVTVAANPLAVIESMKGEDKINYVENEFDRVLAIVKNDNINFEIQKLKSLVFSLPPVSRQPYKDQSQLSKDEILTALIGSKNEFLTALKSK